MMTGPIVWNGGDGGNGGGNLPGQPADDRGFPLGVRVVVCPVVQRPDGDLGERPTPAPCP